MKDAALTRLPRRFLDEDLSEGKCMLNWAPTTLLVLPRISGLDLILCSFRTDGVADKSRLSPLLEVLLEAETLRATLTPAHFTLHNLEILNFVPLCETSQKNIPRNKVACPQRQSAHLRARSVRCQVNMPTQQTMATTASTDAMAGPRRIQIDGMRSHTEPELEIAKPSSQPTLMNCGGSEHATRRPPLSDRFVKAS